MNVILVDKEIQPMELLDLDTAFFFEVKQGHIQVEKLPGEDHEKD